MRRRTTLRTGHEEGCGVRPWPMRSLRLPFFCLSNVRVTNVAWWRISVAEARGSSCAVECHSWTSAIRNGCEEGPALEYSPGRSKKKKASHMRSAAAREWASPAAVAMDVAWCRRARGIGFTRFGGASDLEKLRRRRVMRVSMVLEPVAHRGSARPMLVNVCATAWIASATVLDRTAWPLAENRPSRTQRAKICSHATGSGQEVRWGSRWCC